MSNIVGLFPLLHVIEISGASNGHIFFVIRLLHQVKHIIDRRDWLRGEIVYYFTLNLQLLKKEAGMPVKADPILPLPPVNSKMPGVTSSLLYNGSRFVGHQKSKGNQYDVEVILQVLHLTSDIRS